MKSELPFQRRDEFDQELLRRPISDRARPFLQLMFSAANGTPPEGIKGVFLKVPTPQYVMQGDLRSLAQAMNCSVKTVQRSIEDLLTLGIVQKVADTDSNDLTYSLSLKALLAIPEVDMSTSFGRAVALLSTHDVFESGSESETASETEDFNSDFQPVQAPVHTPVQRGVQGGVQTPVQAPVQAPVQGGVQRGVHPHDHDHDHELIEDSSFIQVMNHDHDARGTPPATGKESARFHQMTDQHIRAIAGFAIEHEGQMRTASMAKRLDKLLEYFRDAVSAGQAEESELRLFAAVFRHVGRRAEVMHKSKYLRTMWTNRNNPDKPLSSVLTSDDRSYARQLLECLQPAS